MRATKKSLYLSGMALLLCCMMLVGSTFAWIQTVSPIPTTRFRLVR